MGTIESYMLMEMREQPEVIKKLICSEEETARRLGAEIRSRDIRFIVIVARGTSDNAATYGKYLFECTAGLPVALAAPSVFTLYDADLRLENALVIGISQSGQGADVVRFIERARELGAYTVAITNTEGSPLSTKAHGTLMCHAGPELAVAATKTYTAELAALVMLRWGMGTIGTGQGSDVESLLNELSKCPDWISSVLSMEEAIGNVAKKHKNIEELVVLARGINHATAMEIALKLQETSYIGAKGFSGADFLHGPMAMVEPGFPILAFAPPGKGTNTLAEVFPRLAASGADVTVVSSVQELENSATNFLKVPAEMPEMLSPIPYAVAGQLYAYHLAIARGLNPDKPRGLKKVTSTM